MRLIEAEKVVQAIKDYWKAQVDRMPTPYSTEEFEKFANHVAMCLEYRDDLLKAIDELPSVQPDTTIYDSNEVKKGENDEDRTSGDCISRQQAINKIKPWLEVKGYSWGELNMLRAVINELENMPSAQPETNCSEIPNNSDTISRQAAIDALHAHLMYRMGTESNKKRLDEWINSLPSAQPERPTGEWIQKPRYEDDEYPDAQPDLKCPFCGYEIGWFDMGNYCARCGADLKGGAE